MTKAPDRTTDALQQARETMARFKARDAMRAPPDADAVAHAKDMESMKHELSPPQKSAVDAADKVIRLFTRVLPMLPRTGEDADKLAADIVETIEELKR